MSKYNHNKLEIHSCVPQSQTEGPGLRFTIWVQGCSIRCEGCANIHMWEHGYGHLVDVNSLTEMIRETGGIEGVTVVGGEPFDQAEPLALLAKEVQRFGLGVIVFTGNIYEELLSNGSTHDHALLEYTDMLIDGPFQKEFVTYDLPWVGSGNQRYIHLSNRYSQFDLCEISNHLEIRFDAEKMKITINGMDNLDQLEKVFDRLRMKGVSLERREEKNV